MEEKKNALDMQVGGSHYKNLAIQPIEYIEKNHIGFAAGCVIKYVSRYKEKNGAEDLKKAKHFIDLLLEIEYGEKQDDDIVFEFEWNGYQESSEEIYKIPKEWKRRVRYIDIDSPNPLDLDESKLMSGSHLLVDNILVPINSIVTMTDSQVKIKPIKK